LANKGSQPVYNTNPKSRQWLNVNGAINIVRGFLPKFYIFEGKRMKDDYIKSCKLGHVWQCKRRHEHDFF
jgi:hypothetical protein